jgi:hypothetical protein
MREGGKPDALKATSIYKYPPVSMREFVCGEYYLNKKEDIYDKVLEELIEINTPGKYVEIVCTGGIGCVSADTEFLSPVGWVRMDEWDGQQVMQVAANDTSTFVLPLSYVVKPCDQFYHLHTKYGVDQMLSAEHRVWYETTKGNMRFTTAQDLYEQHTNSVKGWTGKLHTTFTPATGTELVLSDAEIRVQVMVQADGTFPKHLKNSHCIVKVKKERKKDRARKLLEAAHIAYKQVDYSNGYSRITFLAPLKTKVYDWGWQCSQPQLQLIAEECLHWDGHKNNFFTTIESDADFIQYAMCAGGKRAVKEYDSRALAPHWIVRANPNTEVSIQGVPKTPIDIVPSEDGKKYCFEVPEGRFVIRRNGKVVITGNSAKTTTALYTQGYQLYLLSCMHAPHRVFGLDSASEILIVFQSINAATSKSSFTRFKTMLEGSDYFKENFPFDKHIESKLVFPHRIEVVPVSGMETAVIGQNVIGGLIDELNYMSIVNKSKQSVDQGTYNQAVALYNSIARRRKSRFISGAEHLPGLLCLVSSKRYPGQFTDIKEAESKREIAKTGSTTIYIYDYRVWDVKPKGTFNKGNFKVFIGDMTWRTGIADEVRRYARGFGLPLKFVIEDNGLSTNTPTAEVWGETLAQSTLVPHGVNGYRYERQWPHVGSGKWVSFG